VSERAFYPDPTDGSSKDGGTASRYERVNDFFSIQRFNESRGDNLLHPSYFLLSYADQARGKVGGVETSPPETERIRYLTKSLACSCEHVKPG
jgi:hypothetical protein